MITFDIVRVNKSDYTNRYYISIAFSYRKKNISMYIKDRLYQAQIKHDKGGHPQDGEFQAIYKIHKEFTLLRIYYI